MVATADPASPAASHALAGLLERLAGFYGLDRGGEAAIDAVAAVTRESLPGVLSAADRTFSAINGNGLPVQLSVSLGAAAPALRVLGEVGMPGMSMPERLCLTSFRLREIIRLLDMQEAAPAINRVFAALLPPDPEQTLRWTGGIWIGVAASAGHAVRLRLYLNQRWGPVDERCGRVMRLLDELGWAAAQDLRRVAPQMSAAAIPYGVAFDLARNDVGRLKVYFACEQPTTEYWRGLLQSLGLSGRSAAIAGLVGLCGRRLGELPPGALLPSLELAPDSAEPPGLKVDVSCNHLGVPDTELDRRITEYASTSGIDISEYRGVLGLAAPSGLNRRRVARIQYCGIGLHPYHDERLNVYVCPELQ